MEKVEDSGKKKLDVLASKYINNQVALKAFLKYCKVGCGWLPYSMMDEEKDSEQVEICLKNFKKDHPIYAEHILLD